MGSASNPISSTTQILNKAVGATSDNQDGSATFTFDSPPAGQTWTGTLCCANAPGGAVFTATIGSTAWGSWGGNSVFGPIQIIGQGSQQLVVQAIGLQLSTNYTMNLVGSSDGQTNVAPIWPDATSSALQAEFVGGASNIITTLGKSIGTGTTTLYSGSLSVTATAIGVVFGSTASSQVLTVTVSNATTGQSHTLRSANTPLLSLVVGNNNEFYFPVTVAAGQSLLVQASSSPALVDEVQVIAYNQLPSIMVQNTPNASFDVVQYGGLLQANDVFSTTSAQILAAPPSGYAWRLHNWQNYLGAAPFFLTGDSTPSIYYGSQGTAYAAPNFQPGQLATTGIWVFQNSATPNRSILWYDQVALPSIS